MKTNGFFAPIAVGIALLTGCIFASEEPATDAAASLAKVKSFAFGGIGVAGITSPSERLFRQVFTSPNASSTFHNILSNGTPEAKLYALCALHSLEPKSFAEYAAPLKKSNPEVETIGGCMIMKLAATGVIGNIAAGRYDFFLDQNNWRR